MKRTDGCSKCGGPRDRVGQRYCKACHRLYARANRPKRNEIAGEARRKMLARERANIELKRGGIERTACEGCGTWDGLEMHHDDYDQPLKVRWLCRRCHLEHHGIVPVMSPASPTFPGVPRETIT